MPRDVLIVGQGIAGTLLGWELERAGIPFEIVDAGHARSASQVAAGMLTPITGQRLVPGWRFDELLPVARAAYCEMETAWDVPLWRDMRVRRIFASDRERIIFREKSAAGLLGPHAGDADEEGFWIEGAAQVDLSSLISSARARWRGRGVLREGGFDWEGDFPSHELIVDCGGRAAGRFGFVPWEYSKGEIISVRVDELDPRVILNRGHWILPMAEGIARVGATHESGKTDVTPTPEARAALEASASTILNRAFSIVDHQAGVRVNLPDRRPVAGRHPEMRRLGILNGLGARGALFAPWLARQWVNHLTEGVAFEAEIDVARFWRRHWSQG
ncbi:MAG: hypothetical protein JWM88_238 [Verrucomicrobia bacterium]|nr:hypothetical protein [Verrucomicrobiota bacterium]